MSVRLSPNLPANVVEIGVEISQAKLDAINNGSAPAAGNPFTTVSYITGLSYATQSWVTSQGYLTDAPSNGNEYVRKNGAWSVATGGGGGGGGVWGSITGTITDQTDLTTYITGFGYQTSSDVSTYVTGLGYQTATDVSTYVTGLGYITSTAKSVNTQSGSTYTFASGDANNIVYVPSGSGGGMSMDLYVPDDGTYNFAVGTIINFCYDTSGMTGINITTPLMGTPTLIGNTGTISGGIQGQRTFTKLASNYWLIA